MKINNWDQLEIIINKGKGFIYNDFGTHESWDTPKNNKLHKASCPYLKMLTPNSSGWTYYFDTVEEAISWLELERKDDGYCKCKNCLKND